MKEYNNIGTTYINLGKYIIAYEEWTRGKKLPHYILCNKDNEFIHLGTIKWFSGWRKFCWFTDELFDDIVFDSKCLREIEDFLEKLNKIYKEGAFKRNE